MNEIQQMFESLIEKYSDSKAKMIEYKLKYESLENRIMHLESQLISARATIQILQENAE